MKKYTTVLCCLLGSLALLTGCEKELMDYEGEDNLYFDVRRGPAWLEPNTWAHQFFTTVEFGNLTVDEVTVSCKIMASGMPKDYDRPFTVTINKDSTTAIAGSDFDPLKEDYVIKAGETNAIVSLIVHRTERMDGDTLRLQLQLHANEFFSLNYTNFGDYSLAYSPEKNPSFDYNKDAGVHNIFLYDVLSRPAAWNGNDVNGLGTLGKFSAKKFRLMMKLSNTTIEDFKSSASMPSIRQSAIGELVSKYLLEQAAANTPVLDEDGTMMYLSAVTTLGGSKAWRPFTKPEDYYK